VTTPSEQLIVSALRRATDAMPLPPESRWIRERGSTSRLSAMLMISVTAVLVIAVVVATNSRRLEPRVVPAAGADAFAAREDAEWALAHAVLPSDFVLLRPTWIPSEFRGSAECASPWASFETLSPSYVVKYQGQTLPNGRCAWIVLTGVSRTTSYAGLPDGLDDTGTIDVRGTVVHVRSGTPRTNFGSPPLLDQIRLWWNESGATYEVFTNAADLADLVRVVRGLEQMR
jgi:hypothetical protein